MRKTANDVREMLRKQYDDLADEFTLLDTPAFAEAVVGVSFDDRVIYDYSKMIECLVNEDNMNEQDAIQFLDCNTLRVVHYMPDPPIILFPLEK